MVEVLFFARIREQLGVDRVSISLPSAQLSLGALKQCLIDQHGAHWSVVLLAENVVKAVNQTVVDDDYIVNEGDEVAFFPPVTGG